MKSSSGFILFLLALVVHTVAQAATRPAGPEGLASPFPSTVDGITIRNTHVVAKGKGLVLRGMSPAGHIEELKDFGVTDVLIFKNPVRNDVAGEIAELREAGLQAKRIYHIPFKWKDLGEFSETCRQTVQGLDLLAHAYGTSGRILFFHCSMGEDRTGYLAGLFRMLVDSWSARQAFEDEMCAKGYEAGDSRKPRNISEAVREELTPAFVRMAQLIRDKRLTLDNLDPSVCDDEAGFDFEAVAKKFQCVAE